LSDVFAKGILILWLFVSPFAPSRPSSESGSHAASAPIRQRAEASLSARPLGLVREVRSAGAETATRTAVRRRHVYGAAARAVERRLLLVAPRSKLLARFVDRSTGLVKLNVTAHCALRLRPHRHSVYLCRVWRQPRRPSSGIKVLCRTKHKRFVVMAYRRHRRR
jgi:hypothetical protein